MMSDLSTAIRKRLETFTEAAEKIKTARDCTDLINAMIGYMIGLSDALENNECPRQKVKSRPRSSNC